MEKQKLIEYLEAVYGLEKQKRIAQNTMTRLSEKYKAAKQNFDRGNQKRIIQKNPSRIFALGICIWAICFEAAGIYATISPNVTADSASLVIGGIIILVSGGCYLNMNRKTAEKQKEEDDYAFQQAEMGKKDMAVINENFGPIQAAHQQTQELLNQLYAWNIIHPKYRHLEACGMFLEYLSTGRTHSLEAEGADRGAYNIYEEELYRGIIIDKLDQVLSNQRILIEGQRQIAQSINSMVRSVDYACQSLDKIQRMEQVNLFYNAVTAYNSSVSKKFLLNG